MACGCSSSSFSYSSGSPVSSGCGDPGCRCVLPRRSSVPPVVPVIWTDVARTRQTGAGILLVRCGDEVMSLDSPINGVVRFDAATQKAYVGNNSVEWIADLFPCPDEALFGFPVYALRPECRDMGQNPDRQLAVARPPNSPYGIIYAHQRDCAAPNGLLPEVTPVQLVPDDFPEVAPTNLMSVTWVLEPATEECSAAKRHYYATPGEHVSSVDQTKIRNWAIPAPPFTAEQDAEFGLAAWLYNATNTKWELQKVSNASLQQMIQDVVAAPPIFMLDTRQLVYYQVRSATPPNPAPPVTPETVSVNMTAIPGWDPSFKGVILTVYTSAVTYGGNFGIYINIDGILRSSSYVGNVDSERDSDTNQVFIKLNPANNTIQITLGLNGTLSGLPDGIEAYVYVEGFFK